MSTRLLYRVENPATKIGPYDGRVPLKNKGSTDKQPGPYSDGLGDFLGDYHFAFPSLESALEWFYDELEVLHKHNFKLVVISVPDTHCVMGRSGRQAVFDPVVACRLEGETIEI